MYRVYCDSYLLYDDSLDNLKIIAPKVELELNKTGSFSFSIYPDHPYYELLYKLKSIITVYQDDFLLFRGRILNDELGFYNEKLIECEGEMAFLLDTVVRPYEFSGSIRNYLQMLITSHNDQVSQDKKFTLGDVTVSDVGDSIDRSSIDYISTFDAIQENLLNILGGYLSIRRAGNISYIDYLKDFTLISPQKIEFAKNLLELKRIRKGEEIASGLIPLGAKIKDESGGDTDERLTVKSVNGGNDYIYDEVAVSQYGWIFSTQIFDDVTVAEDLLSKGRAHLNTLIKAAESLELSAADLATVNESVTSFHLGTYVNVSSSPHGIDQNLLVSKLSIDLLDPTANKLVLGGVIKPLTGMISGTKGLDGEDGEDAIVYNVEILSSNGNIFKNGIINTVLSCHVYMNDEEITSQIDAGRFRWKKINNDGTHDTAWEASHAGGTKEIAIHTEDVQVRATFTCTVDGIPKQD